MDTSDDLQVNPYYQFCKLLCEELDSETLEAVASDRAKTIEVVKENVARQQPDKVNDQQYIESVVDEMQKVASEVLDKRSQN